MHRNSNTRGMLARTMPVACIGAVAAVATVVLAACGSAVSKSAAPLVASTAPAAASSAPTATTNTHGPPSTGGPTSGEAANACRLIALSEAQTAVGGTLGPPMTETGSAGASCTYREPPTGGGGAGGSVKVEVFPSRPDLQAYKDLFAGKSPRPLPGVGDDGFLAPQPAPEGVQQLKAVFRVGSTAVIITLTARGSTDAIAAKAQTLAGLAVRRV